MELQMQTLNPQQKGALHVLKKNFGIMKGKEKSRLTKSEKEKIAKHLLVDLSQQKKIRNEFGL